jgi:hypothetical protein
MNNAAWRIAPRSLITRHFECSRHQRDNLVAAFEHVLPVIRRSPLHEPTPRPVPLPQGRQRRAMS